MVSARVAANEHIPRSRCRAVPASCRRSLPLETSGEQRFIAGSVCSPSYWNIQEKIGLSMAAVHQPVTTLETKIGEQIRRFIRHSPVMTPFERSNWFVHGDRERLHLSPEDAITTQPHQWFVRSERETPLSLCRRIPVVHDQCPIRPVA